MKTTMLMRRVNVAGQSAVWEQQMVSPTDLHTNPTTAKVWWGHAGWPTFLPLRWQVVLANAKFNMTNPQVVWWDATDSNDRHVISDTHALPPNGENKTACLISALTVGLGVASPQDVSWRNPLDIKMDFRCQMQNIYRVSPMYQALC